VSGPDAARLVDRVITRDVMRMRVGQVFYTPWCDEEGMVIDDGTVARLDEQRFRWTAAEPTLRWLAQNAAGLDVRLEDTSESTAALALQGPTSAAVLRSCAAADIDSLRYFHVTSGSIGGVPVDISRTGYTGDLGYEIWMDAAHAVHVWDTIIGAGQPFDIKPVGMLALDVARVEAGLLLVDVDFNGSRKAAIAAQKYTPYQMGLGRLVSAGKGPFIGRDALAAERQRTPRRAIVGLEVDWTDVEALYEREGLAPVAPGAASRQPVPVVVNGLQVGRATTTAWSPVLKRLIALATIDAPHFGPGTPLRIEITIEGTRRSARATVVPTPFFNPARKAAAPPR
jgi:aminomethyltransferase